MWKYKCNVWNFHAKIILTLIYMPFLQLYLYLDNSENHGHMTHVPSSLAYFEEILDEMKLQNDEPDVNYSPSGKNLSKYVINT